MRGNPLLCSVGELGDGVIWTPKLTALKSSVRFNGTVFRKISLEKYGNEEALATQCYGVRVPYQSACLLIDC